MRITFVHRWWPYVWRGMLFVVIFAAIGAAFLHFHAREVSQTQQYVESGSPLVIVVDDPVVLDMVNHIVQGHSRVVLINSVTQVDKNTLRTQMGSELMRARYIFFAVGKKEDDPSGSIVYLDDFVSPANTPVFQPVYISATSTVAVSAVASSTATSSSVTSSAILVYGATTTPELSSLSERYFWLSPTNAEEMASGIARTLGTNDAINKTFFINNAYDYSSQISSLRASGYVAGRMKNVPAVVVDGRYIDFPVDFGFSPRAVVDGASFDAAHEQSSFDLIVRALKDTKTKTLFVPDYSFPLADFRAYTRTHRITVSVVALAPYPEQSDEGYLDILQYNILRLQSAVL